MIDPNEEEAKALKTAQYFERLEKSPAWTILKARMTEMVGAAHETMIGAAAPEPNIALALLTRYQQRVAMQRDIETFVESQAQIKKQILESLEEPSGENQDEHESDNY